MALYHILDSKKIQLMAPCCVQSLISSLVTLISKGDSEGRLNISIVAELEICSQEDAFS